MPVLCPDIKAASDATIGAYGLGPSDAGFAHRGFSLGDFQDRSVAGVRLDSLNDIDHAVQGPLRDACQESRGAEHGFFHQCVAGTNRDAMTAGNATRLANLRSAIP